MADWKMYPNEVLRLINYYKKFDCLWNYRSADYKRSHLKRDAWEKLSKEFGKDVEDIKKKVKYLRSAYVNEKKKVDDSIQNGGAKYQPRLFYYNEFNYLDSVIVLRKTPLDPTSKVEHIKEITSGGDAEDTMDQFNLEEVLMPIRSHSPSPSVSTSPERRQKKKRRASTPLKFDDVLDTSADYDIEKRNQQKTIYTAFGNTVALQLGQLTQLEATCTMDEIHQLLSRNVMRSLTRRRSGRLAMEEKGSQSKSAENNRTNRLKAALEEADICFDDNSYSKKKLVL